MPDIAHFLAGADDVRGAVAAEGVVEAEEGGDGCGGGGAGEEVGEGGGGFEADGGALASVDGFSLCKEGLIEGGR